MKKLDADTITKLEAAASALIEAANNARAYFDEKSEKWQDSDAGTDYAAWIAALESSADAIECIDHAPGA